MRNSSSPRAIQIYLCRQARQKRQLRPTSRMIYRIGPKISPHCDRPRRIYPRDRKLCRFRIAKAGRKRWIDWVRIGLELAFFGLKLGRIGFKFGFKLALAKSQAVDSKWLIGLAPSSLNFFWFERSRRTVDEGAADGGLQGELSSNSTSRRMKWSYDSPGLVRAWRRPILLDLARRTGGRGPVEFSALAPLARICLLVAIYGCFF